MTHARLSFLFASLLCFTLACQARDLTTKADPKPTEEPTTQSAAALDAAAKPCPDPIEANDNLNATLWLQSSAERRGLVLQTYASATERLDDALKDKKWVAAAEQEGVAEGDLKKLKPAVIVDVDETVLDNSPYQARLVMDGQGFSPDTWGKWVSEKKAIAIPGAVEFAKKATEKGVVVFYVTNRNKEQEADTRANLEQVGFPLDKEVDTVLMSGEQEGWSSAKGTRRKHVAQNFRIIMLLGDNLGDFTDEYQGGLSARDGEVDKRAAWWGERWFMLPNPSYGSWESAIVGKEKEAKKAHDLRVKALNPAR